MVMEFGFYQLFVALSSCFVIEPVFLLITLILLGLGPQGPIPDVHLLINTSCAADDTISHRFGSLAMSDFTVEVIKKGG